MIVDQPASLHRGIHGGGPDKDKTVALQRFCQSDGLSGGRGDVGRSARSTAHSRREGPEKLIEPTAATQANDGLGVGDGGPDLEPVADDGRVGHQTLVVVIGHVVAGAHSPPTTGDAAVVDHEAFGAQRRPGAGRLVARAASAAMASTTLANKARLMRSVRGTSSLPRTTGLMTMFSRHTSCVCSPPVTGSTLTSAHPASRRPTLTSRKIPGAASAGGAHSVMRIASENRSRPTPVS